MFIMLARFFAMVHRLNGRPYAINFGMMKINNAIGTLNYSAYISSATISKIMFSLEQKKRFGS